MRKLFCFSFLVFFTCCSCLLIFTACKKSSHDQTDEEKDRETAFNNHIRSITEYKIVYRFGVAQPEQVSYVKQYDVNGFKVHERAYKPDGSIDFKLYHEYDASGNLIVITALNGDSGILFRETRSYD